jgi:hypothetical protein
LFKQRDIFKGWRPRHFVLQDDFLHYYLSNKDIVPKKSLQISGCTVTVVKSTKMGDVEYFPFVVSHRSSTKTYNLASTSKEESDKWVEAITAASKMQASSLVSTPSSSERILSRRPVTVVTADSDDDSPSGGMRKPVNAEKTVVGIPAKYANKVETAVETLLDAISSEAEGWEPLFEKNNVKAFRRPGNIVAVRGDSFIPYPTLNVFSTIEDPSKQKELDSLVHSYTVLKACSSHTTIEHVKHKQVWPAQVRDFVNISHWRLLKNGSIAIVVFSEKFDELCPVEQGVVRAELVLAGYVLTPASKGTNVSIVVQTDLKGALPTSLVDHVSSTQPLILANLRAVLDNDVAAGKLAIGKFKSPTYEELLFVADTLSAERKGLAQEMANIETHNSLETEAPDSGLAAEGGKAQKLKSKLSDAVQNATDPNIRRSRVAKLTLGRMCVLFMPVMMYIAVPEDLRALGFIFGLAFALSYISRLHLGMPIRKVSTNGFAKVPSGRMVINFAVDLTRLIRYLEMKRDETNLEVSITHLVVKGSAVAISEVPSINGHIIGEDFYPSRAEGVDISVSMESAEGETTFVKIVDADRKPIGYVADEIINRAASFQEPGTASAPQMKVAQYVNLLPNIVGYYVKWIFSAIGSYGVSVPALGIEGFPHGVCTVVSVPRVHDPHSASDAAPEHDMTITMVPQMTDSTAPISVSIAGVGYHPTVDKDKKMIANRVLNISVAIDTNAGSLANCRRFCTKLQHYLNNPALLDKVDRLTAISKEDMEIAEEKAAAKAALYQAKK